MLTKRKYESTPQDTNDKVLYEQVHSPSPSVTKNDPQCQKNPAYDLSKTIVDTIPTYEICKWWCNRLPILYAYTVTVVGIGSLVISS